MSMQFRIQVFGKPGCDKCSVLNQRLDRLLEQKEWGDFEKQYCDIGTEEGLVAFCEAECINPQRIPAILVTRRHEGSDCYEPLPNTRIGEEDAAYGDSRLYQHLGLQTDYSTGGRGLITPRMLTTLLGEARSTAPSD